MALRFASLHQAQRNSSPSRWLAPWDKALGHALHLSTRLSMSPRRVKGSHPRTRLGFTLCFSPPGSACLLAKSRACTTQQGLNPRFASIHQAQCVSSQSRRLAPRNKAWVHVLPLSTRLSMSPRRFAESYRKTRLGSTLCLSPSSSALLFAKSRACTAGQDFSLSFASLHQIQRVSPPSCGLTPQDMASVYALPLSTRLSVSSRRFAGSHPRTMLGS